MAKVDLSLRPSEANVFRAAATIYAAYVTAGKVETGSEDRWLQQALKDAVRLAKAADDLVVSDGEFD